MQRADPQPTVRAGWLPSRVIQPDPNYQNDESGSVFLLQGVGQEGGAMEACLSLYVFFCFSALYSRSQKGEIQTGEENFDHITFPTKAPPSGGSIMISQCVFELHVFQRVPEARRGHIAKISRAIDLDHLEIFFEHHILASVFVRECRMSYLFN